MANGVVKKVDPERGLGYIQGDDGREIFVIAKGLEDKLKEGTPVHFDRKQTRVGVIAVNVEIVHQRAS